GNSCTHCMACITRCPEEAIEFKNKTQGKVRHYLSE
ncbi:MAG: 4Fe-4S binding protein, partial [Raoultibacter sp.]